MMINAGEFEAQWKEIRGQVRPRWQAITDAEVNRIDGHVDVLVDLLEEKYGYSRLLAEDDVSRFLQDMRPVRTS